MGRIRFTTLNDYVAKYFNRAYETEIYKEASEKLNRLNIKFVTHIIIGLPKEEEKFFYLTQLTILKHHLPNSQALLL